MLRQKAASSRQPNMVAKSFISTLEVFKKLPSNQLSAIEKKMVERKFAKGESLFLEGDPAEYVWFVKEGHVKAVIHTANGRDLTLCMVGANSLFGTCCCFGGEEYPCHSVARPKPRWWPTPCRNSSRCWTATPKFPRPSCTTCPSA